MKISRYIFTIAILIITVLLLAPAVKGNKGNPFYYQSEKDRRVGGPFEVSNTTARYALTEAIVRNNSFFLNEQLAKFASPDVADYKGKFLSLFTPGVSFIAIPYYILGTIIGYPQLITFLTMPTFAILNIFLVARLAFRFGAGFYRSILSGFVFLFATNALVYSQTLTQHHVSTSLIILALLNALSKRTFLNNIIFGFILSAALLVDIPNFFLMLPIIFYTFIKHFDYQKIAGKINLNFKLIILGVLIGLMPLTWIFAWYNYSTTGSYILLAQTIGRTKLFRDQLPEHLINRTASSNNQAKSPLLDLPFDTRKQLNGFHILLFSNERSWLFFSPIVLVGILGFYHLYKSKNNRMAGTLAGSIIVVNVVLYSMFGDVWGGWAFGSRYLIPSAAIMCAALSIALQKYYKNIIFNSFFIILMSYSVAISTIGVMTTNAIPPKVEAVNLSNPIPYTYNYNLQLLDKNVSSSLIYNLFLYSKMTAKTFVYLYVFAVLSLFLIIYSTIFLQNNKGEE